MTRTPRPLGPENRHYWLASRMAKTVGADMQAALDAGHITHEDWAGLITRCRGCQWSGGCDAWMAAQEFGAAPVPAACPNAATFAAVLVANDTP